MHQAEVMKRLLHLGFAAVLAAVLADDAGKRGQLHCTALCTIQPSPPL
jgi:hypothetical protein